MFLILLSIFFLVVSTPVQSRPDGAPPLVCAKLLPDATKHGAGPSQEEPKYELGVQNMTDGKYTFTLKPKDPAADKIKGVLFAVRMTMEKDKEDAELHGMFDVASPLQKMDCTSTKGSYATHMNPDEKDSATATWTPPSAGGKFTVFSVVAKEKEMYWQLMEDIEVAAGPLGPSTGTSNGPDPGDAEGSSSVVVNALIILLMLGLQLLNGYK